MYRATNTLDAERIDALSAQDRAILVIAPTKHVATRYSENLSQRLCQVRDNLSSIRCSDWLATALKTLRITFSLREGWRTEGLVDSLHRLEVLGAIIFDSVGNVTVTPGWTSTIHSLNDDLSAVSKMALKSLNARPTRDRNGSCAMP